MQRLSAWVRRIATTILIPIFTAVAARFIWEQPPETTGAVLRFFLNLAEQTWLRVTALVLGGFVAGLWLDWLLRKLDRSRAEARKDLGFELLKLASELAEELERVDRNWQRLRPRLMSAFIKARGFGLWAPDDEVINRGDRLGHSHAVPSRSGHYAQGRTFERGEEDRDTGSEWDSAVAAATIP
jgi:hypothetical protein